MLPGYRAKMFCLQRRVTAKASISLVPALSGTVCASRRCHISASADVGATTGADSDGSHRGSHFAIDPSKLDLGLQLDKMDFGAMVAATGAAISTEKRGTVPSTPAVTVDAKATHSPIAPTSEPPPPSAELQSNDKVTSQSFARYGDRGRPAVRATPLAKVTAVSRYSLVDMLRDCVMNGNWPKAYRAFEEAVHKACADILLPTTRDTNDVDGVDAGDEHDTNGPSRDRRDARAATRPGLSVPPAREVECFVVLRTMKQARQASPATQRTHVAATAPTTVATLPRSVVGIMRWHAGHFHLLLRVLLEAGRLAEVARVWDVMEGIGFVAYEMDERALNALIGLFHRHEAQFQAAPPPRRRAQGEQDGARDTFSGQTGTLPRRLILALNGVAAQRGMTLEVQSQRVVAVASAAQLLLLQQACSATAPTGGTNASMPPGDDHTGAINEDALQDKLSKLTTSDFNALLRTATGEQMTQRVLALMARLHVALDSESYASLITALHTPGYVLQDNLPSAVECDGRPLYEQNKDQRIARARRWLDACTVGQRTAVVYNAMLYLLRSVRHAAEFDAILSEWRGNAVRTTADRDHLLRTAYAAANARRAQRRTPAARSAEDDGSKSEKERGDDEEEEEVYLSFGATAGTAMAPSAVPIAAEKSGQTGKTTGIDVAGDYATLDETRQLPPILSPQWSTPPDGKTYELLIQRARYLHDWQGAWQLYEEMKRERVRGTVRLYQRLISDAKSHPPRASDGRAGDTSQLVMRIYQDMQSQQLDVTSLESTITLLNAWSGTRRGRRWT